ncbi:protein of unknown function [Nitrospira japonica]|uniref:Uncharacterized protein n=1 Tax=Nitrospira japonica TaxID=1325564 RepID=A0A1W1I0M6_9BACT|nr:hypothetical protein [Nitrospira japonica]SLM46527.1 protein of unknown function [Nitrospira japonica]
MMSSMVRLLNVRAITVAMIATVLFLFGCATTLVAAQEQLDLPRYSLQVPAGWSSQVDGERWMLYPSGGANELGIAPVGTGLQLGETLTRADAHRQLWASALSSRQVLQANPTQQDKDDLGRQWTVDSAIIQEAGTPYLLLLSVVELAGRAEGFLTVGTPSALERHQKSIDAVLNSVRPREPAKTQAARMREKAPVFGRPSPLGTSGPGRLTGVWTATTHELRYGTTGLANKPVVSELILFADGTALWGMPGEGLLGFDRTAYRARWPERWGAYTARDKQVIVTRGKEERLYAVLQDGVLEHRYIEGGKERTGERFIPRPSLDGVRLDSEVRRKDHWPAPGNASGLGTLKGLSFSRDGTFHDDKLMWIVSPDREGESKEAHEARVLPGQGHYRFEHWTLVLEYDDGRVNRVGFVATDREQPMKGAILNGYPIEPNPY